MGNTAGKHRGSVWHTPIGPYVWHHSPTEATWMTFVVLTLIELVLTLIDFVFTLIEFRSFLVFTLIEFLLPLIECGPYGY